MMKQAFVVLALVWMVSGTLYSFTTTRVLDSTDDTCSSVVTLAGNFKLFNSNFNSFYVNPNGQIFISACQPSTTPLSLPINNDKFIAVYWANADFTVDVDPRSGVYYQTGTGASPIDSIVSLSSVEYFIVTWFFAPYFTQQVDRYNSFQAVVATDRTNTYACFQYANSAESANANGGLDWSEGTGYNTALGGINGAHPAAVGFNAGDNSRYYTHPDSYSERIRSIDGFANGAPAATQVGSVAGQYCYLISGTNIVSFAKPVITSPQANSYFNAGQLATFPIAASDINTGLVATITITSGSTTITTTATGDINHQISITQNIGTLPDGPFTVTLSKSTSLGTYSSTVTATKDTVDPVAPVITSPASLSWVNDNTQYSFQVSGTGESGTTVTVSFTDSASTTVTQTALVTSSSWTATVSLESLIDGNVVITARARDPAGNLSPVSSSLTVRLDTTISVANTSPAPSTVYSTSSGLNSVTFAGTTDLASNTVTVIVQSSSTSVQQTTSGTSWSVNLDISGLADGISVVYSTATDAAGNSVTASSSIIKDTSTYVAFDPLDPFIDSFSASSFYISGSSEALDSISLYIGSTLLSSTTAASDYTWEFSGLDLSSFSDGPFTFTVTAVDPLGNTASETSPTITLDTSTTVTITSPPDLALLTISEVTNLQITGTGERSGQVTLRISDINQDTYYSTTASSSTGDWSISSIDISNLFDGFIDVEATLVDPAGNVAFDSIQLIKDSGTFASISSPSPSQLINYLQQVNLIITGFGETFASVYVTISDTQLSTPDITTSTVIVSSTNTWSVTASISSLVDGPITFVAHATDLSFNSASSNPITSTKDTVSFVSFRTPLAGDIVNSINVANSLFTGSAEPFSLVRVVATDYLGNSASSPLVSANYLGSWATSANLNTILDGPVTLTASASDVAGNPSSSNLPVTKDTSTIVLITSPTPNIYVNRYGLTTLTVQGTGEPFSSVYVTIDDGVAGTTNVVTSTITVSSLGYWQFNGIDITSLADGTLRITATLTDIAGNTKNSPVVTIIKDTMLVITIAVPQSFQYLISDARSFSVPVSGFGDPAANVYVTYSDGGGGYIVTPSALITPVGTWSVVDDISDLDDGIISITATASDVAGNVEYSQTITMTKDTSVSVTVINTPLDGSTISHSQSSSLFISGTGEPGTLSLRIAGTTGVVTNHTTVFADGTWSTTVNITALPNGPIEIGGTASDFAGNTATINEITIYKN